MKNIDDLMQQQYDNDDPNSRFAFREEYWEQALALIEADETKRRKKRRWLLWWSLAGLLLVVAGLGFWEKNFNNIKAKTAGQVEKSIVAVPNQEKRQAANAQMAINNTENEKRQEANAQMAMNNTENEKRQEANAQMAMYNTENEKRQEANAQMAINNIENEKRQEANAQMAINNIENEKEQGFRGKTIKNNATQKPDNTSKLAGNPMPNGQQTGKANNIPEDFISGKTQTNNTISRDTLSTSKAASTRSDLDIATIPGQPLPNSSPGIEAKGPPDNTTKQDQTQNIRFAPIFALPLPMNTISSNSISTAKKPSPVPLPVTKQIKPVRDSRYVLGFAAATAAYQPAPDKRWLGFSGSFFGAYKLSASWSASIGLGLRYQPGNWQDNGGTIRTESLRYSFGFEALKTQRRALGLLSLEIPIAAAWHRGAFAAEAGIAPGRLLFALERYEETAESSLKAPETTRNRLERGETNIYHQFYANAFAGLEWKFTQNASINVRGNYRLGAILKPVLEEPSIKGGSNLELGLTWRLGG